MEKVAEEKTLSRTLVVVPTLRRRPVRNYVCNTNLSTMRGRFGIQKIEFEGDPDVPLISHEDFRDAERAIVH